MSLPAASLSHLELARVGDLDLGDLTGSRVVALTHARPRDGLPDQAVGVSRVLGGGRAVQND